MNNSAFEFNALVTVILTHMKTSTFVVNTLFVRLILFRFNREKSKLRDVIVR